MSKKVNLYLQNVISFTEADLAANKEGKLTLSQHQIIWDGYYRRFRMSAIYHIPLLLTLVGVFIVGTSCLYLLFFTSMMSAFVFSLTYRDWVDASYDVEFSKVHLVCGVVTRTINDQGFHHFVIDRDRLYRLQISTLSLPVTEAQAYSFENGERYCIYYMPATKTIISTERI